jgi:hypothetical protein
MTLREVLQIIVIPIVVAAIGLLWPLIQSRYRKYWLMNLILRELEEAEPYPKQPEPHGDWSNHMTKPFIHRRFFENPSELILSLDPDTAYKVGQLWASLNQKDARQWLYYWQSLSGKYGKKNPKLNDIHNKWQSLITLYSQHAVPA